MEIEYLGHSCFRILSQNGTSIITDPYTKVGYELPKTLKADIVTISHGHFDHNFKAGVTGVQKVIDGEGKHAFADITMEGFLSYHDPVNGALRGKNIVFVITVDGVRICHLGDVGESCSEKLLSQIGAVDVLLIPVGGTYTIDAKQAKEYVEEMKPRVVVPMHYKPKDGTIDITDEKSFLSLCKEVVYAKKNARVDLRAYFSDKTETVFMERMENE